VHQQEWPLATSLGAAAATDPAILTAVGEVLAGIRGAKSTAKVTQRTPRCSHQGERLCCSLGRCQERRR
jgi:hypothetical protein